MYPRIEPSAQLLDVASRQSGVITSSQATAYGLGRRPVERLVAAGRWRRVSAGIFFVESTEPPWLAVGWAGLLAGGEGARLGGAAAAHLHGLRSDPPPVITVLVRHSSRRVDREPWLFVRERPGTRAGSVGSPPRLRVEDTVLDLAGDLGERELIDLVSRVVQERRTTPDRLRARLEARSRIAHRSLLGDLLADVGAGAETPLELAYLIAVERKHALPRGIRQHRSGLSPARRDVYYEVFRVVVELDGRLGHEGLGRFRDMRRDNRAALAGEVTLRYGWSDVRINPCVVADQVSRVLRERGWNGTPRACPRCPRP